MNVKSKTSNGKPAEVPSAALSGETPCGDVLVWGGLGFIGQHLIARLLAMGVRVSVLCRSRRLYSIPTWSEQVRWFELDDSNQRDSTLVAAIASADIIYNFAGLSGAVTSNREPLRSLEENCAVQLAFLMACQRAGNRPHVVFPSSWLVYEPGGMNRLNEEHPLGPRSIYGVHKLCIEQYLRIFGAQNHITYTVCRISNPYGFDPSGVEGSYKVLNWFVQLALKKNPIRIFGDGSQLRDFIYIDDLVEALLRCLSPQARNEIFNISSGKSYSMLHAVQIVNELAGPVRIIFQTWPDEYSAVEAGNYVADISHVVSRLGFSPAYDLTKGIERTVESYRASEHPLCESALRAHSSA